MLSVTVVIYLNLFIISFFLQLSLGFFLVGISVSCGKFFVTKTKIIIDFSDRMNVIYSLTTTKLTAKLCFVNNFVPNV